MPAKRPSLDPLFNPQSLAVIGASERPGSVGGQVFAKIAESDFAGPIHPVNPKHKTILGHAAVPHMGALNAPVDLAIIATPAATVPAILADCAAAGTRHAIVLSAGFGEGGGGLNQRDALMQTVTQHELRILGPNCVGLVRPWLDLDATFLRSATPKGRLALVSQSGALCSAISDWAGPNNLGFSALVSLGNALDLGFGEVVQFLADDPQTDAILLYVEGVRKGPAFVSALRYATERKPVIVLKAGRGLGASQAAATHTGALMGNDAVFDAALARAGAVRAMTFGQLFAAAEMLGSGRRASGNRLGIITNGGGAGVLAADRAEDLGVATPPPSSETITALDAVLPPHWSRGNPMDVLGDATPDQFAAAITAALEDPAFDGVLAMLTPQAMTDPATCASSVIDAAQSAEGKPVLACWMGQSSVAGARADLSAAGIPEFTTPERAVEAFSFLAQHRHNRDLAAETASPATQDMRNIARARRIIETALAEDRSVLSSLESKELLSIFGLPVDLAHPAASAAEAADIATKIGAPVAIKIHSPDITHKSDVDGVRLGIPDGPAASRAFDEITERARNLRPEAQIDGVTVEPMARLAHTRELMIGASRDPVFGMAILFGLGGTQVEVLRDRAIALAPLNDVLARRLIARTKANELLDAFRNLPPADRPAITRALLALSDLVCALPEVTSLDINPLLAGPEGVLAIDARVVVKRPKDAARDGPHLSVEA